MKAVICPVCDGEGELNTTTAFPVNCHGCGGTKDQRGRGWIEVHEDAPLVVTITGLEDCKYIEVPGGFS